MNILPPDAFLDLLKCPSCNGALSSRTSRVVCSGCGHSYPIKDGILELIDESALDQETFRELRGNTAPLTQKHIEHMAGKRDWSKYFNHFAEWKLRQIVWQLLSVDHDTVIFLGAGTGYEAAEIASQLPIKTVLCSDLAYAMVAVAPHTLNGANVRLGLFTSDLQSVPIRDTETPIVIHEALHHTQDMHETLRRLLAAGYRDLILVEPVSNWLIRRLSKIGLAGRVEYSGVRPGKMDLGKLNQLAADNRYSVEVSTGWEFPEDYYRRWLPWIPTQLFLAVVDCASAIGRPFRFGNFAVIRLKRRHQHCTRIRAQIS